ncbi:sulfite reductase [NADPH] flavoprotein, alpha-component [Seonamhaeicola sp. S2-3]|uniref:assimilatory sulfite reductase (NADPH) flavoprotein subunit n=1 Tax=Seonamhaeicola sp. S2-3 TaxID=1936081 RepID=UPI000972839A|nr:assimilatory sulfite reductase (NADPH) flavoprotein subunit [Seonamhaeicola sp. S2-3]APY12554.1 sulfite reductase [NADPH] flavoprotein, alpha-component [Seonamhaeicola sp. S2-3]
MEFKKGLKDGPFNNELKEKLNDVLSALNSEQFHWLSGYFSGLIQASSSKKDISHNANIEEDKSKKLNILFGSHTGNSEALAYNLFEQAKERGFEVEVSDMASFKTRNLSKVENLAIIVSTHGLGEPPVQAEAFHKYLHSKKAPNLSHINFSVLGLGDSSYIDFCQTGKDFDTVLEKLGAKRLIPRQDCDVDYEDKAKEWQQIFLDRIQETSKAISVKGIKVNNTNSDSAVKYSQKNLFEATVLEKINLNGKGSSKETIHLELDLQGSGLKYEPGDALGVYGSNSINLTKAVLKATNLTGEQIVKSHSGEKTLLEALTYDYELTPLTKNTLTKYAELTNSSGLKAKLKDNNTITEYLHGRDILDLLEEEPYNLLPNELISVLRKNTPRMYSIASCQDAVDNEVHLLVSVVRYNAFGRNKEGLCSVTLADRLKIDDKVKIFIDKNSRFKLPENPDIPIIMVGPGTGVAPFRAFMQHIEVYEKKTPSWLFFGDRNFTTDFLYQTEWQQYLKEGVLTKADVAFSRDQKQKQYVQHKMLENGKELYNWLEKGAHFYVCGDAQRMAKDVNTTLKEIIQQQGGLSLEKAEDYIKDMQLSNRYQTDVY